MIFQKKNFFSFFAQFSNCAITFTSNYLNCPRGNMFSGFLRVGGGTVLLFCGGRRDKEQVHHFLGGIFGRTTKTTNLEGRGVKALVLRPIRKSFFLRLPLSIYVRKLFLWPRGGGGFHNLRIIGTREKKYKIIFQDFMAHQTSLPPKNVMHCLNLC